MTRADDVIAAARRRLGTPYRAAGAQGCGTNCLGLWVLVARDLDGLKDLASAAAPFAEHCREHKPGEMRRLLKHHLRAISRTEALPGDLMLFRNRQDSAQHLALLTGEDCIIHACNRSGRVVEHRRPADWVPIMVLRIPGLERYRGTPGVARNEAVQKAPHGSDR